MPVSQPRMRDVRRDEHCSVYRHLGEASPVAVVFDRHGVTPADHTQSSVFTKAFARGS